MHTDKSSEVHSQPLAIGSGFTWLSMLVPGKAIVVRKLRINPNGLALDLRFRKKCVLSFSSVKRAKLKTRWLWAEITIFAHDDKQYKLCSRDRNGAIVATAAINGNVQLSGVRDNWDLVGISFNAFEKFLARPGYITNREFHQWRHAHPLPDIPDLTTILPQAFFENERHILARLRNPRRWLNERNREFVDAELVRWKHFFETIESHPLTHQQKLAVLYDEDNTLVRAGAGTGKTSTIVAKTGYILKAGLATAEKILLLSFTRKSAEELQERIKQKLSVDVKVRTFHSLGLEIISEVENRKPAISKEASDEIALERSLLHLLETLLVEDFQLLHAFQNFVTSNLIPYRPHFDFQSLGEYMLYLKHSGMRALSGEMLQSYEEIEIANWLYLNGVRYDYERPYEIDTATLDHRQYKPDFYYPDYGIYHEHFGILKDGSTAPYIDQDEYNRQIEWKRETHRRNGTTLIETYSWMKTDGTLLSELENLLKAKGVVLNPLPPDEVLEQFSKANYTSPILKLLSSFLALFKGSCLNESELLEKSRRSDNYTRNQTFLKIFLPLLRVYEEKHRIANEVDFSDMIRTAVEYANTARYTSPFSYILVDEFQDISQGRARLLQSLRSQVEGCKLFCVGDDWQSIYRFAGSDVSLVTNFRQHFGYTQDIALDQTFRFNNKLVEFSSTFILKNKSQLPKKLTTTKTSISPAVELVMVGPQEDPYYNILQSITAEAPQASVYFIGRNKYVLPKDHQHICEVFPSLRIKFLTAHKSKGLEADYVIICGLKGGNIGFPSELADDPVLNLVLAEPDKDQHAEERRLFYVAVTRARKKVYLVADKSNPSCFVTEIKDDPSYSTAVFVSNLGDGDAYCPLCETGWLVPRQGQSDNFVGCSNYPLCEFTQPLCIHCKQGIYILPPGKPLVRCCNVCNHTEEVCPACRRGTLKTRSGRHGTFVGCSMYNTKMQCRYTRNIHD